MSAGLEDPFVAQRAVEATGLLRAFNEAGVLGAADVHVATRLAELAGEPDQSVRLAVALAVRAPRQGHVFVDLGSIRETANVDESDEPVDLSGLPWPETEPWLRAVTGSQLVALGDEDPAVDQPLRLLGTRLYLDRYWREEARVAEDILALAAGNPEPVEPELDRLFPGELDERQRAAARAAVQRRFAVIAGGPGTGKTTTVARIVALLAERALSAGTRRPLVALAAPTGKAAARLQEAVHAEAAELPVPEDIRTQLLGLGASTLHRLLGRRPGSHSRFRHDRENRLPHDVVIVDETSMVSLWLMARLVEAVRPDARLILVGDPAQLASIEAGVVLGDIVGPAADGPVGGALGSGIVVLERVHRFGGAIGRLAEAIRRGDGDATIAALQEAGGGVTWLPVDSEDAGPDLEPVRARAVSAGQRMVAAARAGAAAEALDALSDFRVLCAHRRGRHGVADWTTRVQGWLSDAVADLDVDRRDYVGRPLLVTVNDYELGLWNGDSGVIVEGDDGHPTAAFERAGEVMRVSPLRLGAVDTVYAMTIHKSQGSQFDTAAVLLPPPDSRILSRELLYTAITRARRELILVGTEEAVRAAVARPVARASGLRERLWGAER